MKATTKFFFALLTLAYALLWAPAPSLALPSACELRCPYPGTDYDECCYGDECEYWTYCYIYEDIGP